MRGSENMGIDGNKKHTLTGREKARIAGFLALLLVLIAIASALMRPALWFDRKLIQNRNARAAQMRGQAEDTIDIMNLGDSLSLSSYSPVELWKERGYTSFNIGMDGLRMIEAVYAVEEACSRQKPVCLMMEALPLLRYERKTEMQETVSMPLYHTFDFLRFHSIWKKAVEEPGIMIYHRGYIVNGKSRPYEGPADYMTDRPMDDHYKTAVPAFNRFLFRRIHAFCRKNGITLVLYSAVSPENYNLPRKEVLEAFAREENVPYIDLNDYADEMGIDWSAHTSDGGDHLNVYGAALNTLFLTERVQETTGLTFTDHRGDDRFRDWEEEVPAYEQLVEDMRGKNFADVRKELEKQKEAEEKGQ